MSILNEQKIDCRLQSVYTEMSTKISRVLNNSKNEPNRIIRLEIKAGDACPLEWLSSQMPGSRGYWRDREDQFEVAYVGHADTIKSNEEVDLHRTINKVRTYLRKVAMPLRYYGGFRFDLGATQPSQAANVPPNHLWEKFGSCRMILPRFELFRTRSETVFACNLIPDKDSQNVETILHELQQLSVLTQTGALMPDSFVERSDNPDRDEWSSMIVSALESCRKGDLRKIVLARQTAFDFGDRIDPTEILARLKQQTGNCYHFLVEADEDNSFVGASPERLYNRNEDQIVTEAVAGTRRRGESTEKDNQLGQELLASDKDNREQQFVTEYISDKLNDLCNSQDSGSRTELLKLAKVQHLITRMKGRLKPDLTDADILGALHPTPAVGGTPTDSAKEQIHVLEPFDRGWYAGPIGWIGADQAEFAVGIRCGLVRRDILHLYSGAGVLPGSTPDDEWDEIENKLDNFIRIVTR